MLIRIRNKRITICRPTCSVFVKRPNCSPVTLLVMVLTLTGCVQWRHLTRSCWWRQRRNMLPPKMFVRAKTKNICKRLIINVQKCFILHVMHWRRHWTFNFILGGPSIKLLLFNNLKGCFKVIWHFRSIYPLLLLAKDRDVARLFEVIALGSQAFRRGCTPKGRTERL